MNRSYDKKKAWVFLPPVTSGRLESREIRRWLSKANLRRELAPRELLSMILGELGVPCPRDGLAALRMWGQTGDRPTVWIAAADPVYLEPRLDHLCLHSMRRRGIGSADVGPLFDHLQDTLSAGSEFGFARLGTYGYIRAEHGIATAGVPAYVVDGGKPDDHLPAGDGSDAHLRLISEIEMALHEHAVNATRIERGQQPINSLWIWGGGYAPETHERTLPVLYADDPLLAGFWESSRADAYRWPKNLEATLQGPEQQFVAVAPESADGKHFLEDSLATLQKALTAGRLSSVTVVFRDGIRAELKRVHSMRIWRRDSELFD